MTVKVGSLTVQLAMDEAAPAPVGAGGRAAGGAGKGGGGGAAGGRSRSSVATKRRSGPRQQPGTRSEAPPALSIQTSANTVDVRGQVGATSAPMQSPYSKVLLKP